VKDEGYKLWQLLSDVLGEKIDKSNFCATVERLGIANSNSQLVNPIQIGHINLCSNTEDKELEHKNTEERPSEERPSDRSKNIHEDTLVENALRKNKLKTISKLARLGLTAEQIAEAIDLPFHEVQQQMEQESG
jgi:hypothetical protein